MSTTRKKKSPPVKSEPEKVARTIEFDKAVLDRLRIYVATNKDKGATGNDIVNEATSRELDRLERVKRKK